MWMLNLGKPVVVPQLNEAMAIDLGANLLGEGIIFVIAAGILYMEYVRQVRKEAAKEDARKEELKVLNFTIQELYFQIERQDAQIRELHRNVHDLEGKAIRKPWKFSSNSQPTGKPVNPGGKDDPPPPTPPPSSAPPSTVEHIQNSEKKHHHDHIMPVPMHLEHINKVISDQPGVLLTAVSYLTNEIFNFKNEYYRDIHLQEQR